MPTPEQQLLALRARIDAMDETLAQLLIERCGIIREVGALKAEHWPGACHIRPGREGQMHETLTKRFLGTDIPPAVALAIWRQLIGASTSLESPLNATTLAHMPHHGWLVREYFGVNAGLLRESSIAEMLDNIAQGTANILLLPAPGQEGGNWWRDAALFTSHQLSVFASLPVTTALLPDGAPPALALAAVTPEASGNDISYLALATRHAVDTTQLQAITSARVMASDPQHHLLVVDGFVNAASPIHAQLKQALGANLLSLTLLGAHPRPISL